MECKHDMWVGAVWAWIFYTKSNICSGGKWHEWDSNNREDAIEYAKKHYIPMTTTKNPIYSCDKKPLAHWVMRSIVYLLLTMGDLNKYNW
jgi:hypothetical protein